MESKLNFFRSLALMVAGLMCFSSAATVDNLSGRVGDMNGDGRIGITDVVEIIDAVLADSPANAMIDINGDGQMTINDITTLIDQVLDVNQTSQRYVAYGVPFTMVIVDGGTFRMGATSEQASEANYDEYPVHQVTLSTYTIGQTQVTQELWEAVMGYNPSLGVINPQNPVENVSWFECQRFISDLNTLTGCQFRLPTEAEWEFAARGGNKSKHYKYSGSNNYDEVAWCELNSNDRTQPVGTKKANELGIYDMSGNVWEWCYDWWDMYSNASCVDPTGPETGTDRVCRGGCMEGHVRFCRIGYRQYYSPETARRDLGLRIAL